MKYPVEKERELVRLRGVMRVLGELPCGVIVYMRSDERENVPHLHLCDRVTMGCRFHCSLLLSEAGYFVHRKDQYPYVEGRHDWISDVEQKEFSAFLRASRDGITNWEYAIKVWNEYSQSEGPRIGGTRIPDYDVEYIEDGPYHHLYWTLAMLKGFCVGDVNYSLWVRDGHYEYSSIPHFHVGIQKDGCCESEFEVSIIDILAKDELKLLRQRDWRDPQNELFRRGRSCSWDGYEPLKAALFAYLKSPSDWVCDGKVCKTKLENVLKLWDEENTLSGKDRNILERYLKRHRVSVLPGYEEYFK